MVEASPRTEPLVTPAVATVISKSKRERGSEPRSEQQQEQQQQEQLRHETRNLSVIAHVDHGKSTLTDAFIQRAGRLSAARAGTARELDTDAMEKERGITIYAAAATLDYDVPARWFDQIDTGMLAVEQQLQQHFDDDDENSNMKNDFDLHLPNSFLALPAHADKEEEEEDGPCEIFVGNLPFDLTDALFEELVVGAEVLELAVETRLRSKRGSATLTFACRADRQAALALLRQRARKTNDDDEEAILAMPDGRPVLVQFGGASYRERMLALCKQQAWSVPVMSEQQHADGEHWIVTWSSSEDHEGRSEPLPTRKLAREAAAHAFLRNAVHGDVKAEGEEEDCKEETVDDDATQHLRLNVVDCPGHVDFNSEVTAALRISDGALVVVDVVEGVCVQTETVLRQAIMERVKPVLFLNKMDRLFMELHEEPQEIAQRILGCVEEVNRVLERELQTVAGPLGAALWQAWELRLERGNVAFGSGYFGWGCLLQTLVDHRCEQTIRQQQGSEEGDVHARVAEVRETISRALAGKGRAALQVLVDVLVRPLQRLHKCVENQRVEVMRERYAEYGVTFSEEVLAQKWKAQLKYALRSALPVAEALLQLIVQHLPSPAAAAPLRASLLLRPGAMEAEDDAVVHAASSDEDEDGDKDAGERGSGETKSADDAGGEAVSGGGSSMEHEQRAEQQRREADLATNEQRSRVLGAMRACDPAGPLHAFVTKLLPIPGTKRLVALCRVFSGRISLAASEATVFVSSSASSRPMRARVQRIVAFETPTRSHAVDCAVAGDVVGLCGIDEHIGKSATLSSAPLLDDRLQFRPLPFVVAPLVSVSVRAARAEDLPSLVDAIHVLIKTDPSASTHLDAATGERVVSGCGELHLEVIVHNLEHLSGAEIVASEPVVSFNETVTTEDGSQQSALGKSSNKHNRFTVRATPLSAALVQDIEAGLFTATMDERTRSALLVQKHGWDPSRARKVWCLGPDECGPNMLVDATSGVQHLNAVRDALQQAFQEVTENGPLCGERLRGVCLEILDAHVHGDSAHRRPVQTVPAAARAMKGAILYAGPRLVEPFFALSTISPEEAMSGVYRVLARRGGMVVDTKIAGPERFELHADVPVRNSLGLTGDLRGETSGHVVPQLQLGDWRVMDQDPYDDSTDAHEIIRSIRDRKRFNKRDIPTADEVADRL